MDILNNVKIKKYYSWIIAALVVLNVLAFILIADNIYFRLDLTNGKKYSISKETKQLISQLDNQFIIDYYYSDNCKRLKKTKQLVRYIMDILKEYENESKGFIDFIPHEVKFDDEEKMDELQKEGFKIQYVGDKTTSEQKTMLVLSGLSLKYKDKPASIIGSVFKDRGFEFLVDIEIKKLLAKNNQEAIGLLSGDKQRSFKEGYKFISSIISQEKKDVRILKPGEDIPGDISVLFIIGGDTFTDKDIFNIDQFLMNGGKAFIALAGTTISNNQYTGLTAVPSESKLVKMLSSYGIDISRTIIADNDSFLGFPSERGEMRYPLWPLITKKNFNKDFPAAANVDMLVLFWPSNITINKKIEKDAVPIFHTTKNSWLQIGQNGYKLSPEVYKYPVQKGEREYYPAYSFSGKLDSYFKDKEIPTDDKGKPIASSKFSEGNAHLIVIADDKFIGDDVLQYLHSKTFGTYTDEIRIFLMNAIDSLSAGHSLITIRNKGKFTKPLDKITIEEVKTFYEKMIIRITTYLIPFLIIVIGIIIIIIRHRKNKNIALKYSKTTGEKK